MTNQTTKPNDEAIDRESKGVGPVIKHALDDTLKLLGYIFAPFIILRFLREPLDDIEFMIERPLLAFVFLLFCAFVLIYFVLRQIGLSKITSFSPWSIRLPSIIGDFHWKRVLRIASVLASFAALSIIAFSYIFVYVSGLHYVVIASTPDRQSAVQEVLSINSYLDKKGEQELRSRAYASTATGSNWYMITIGGFHTSWEAAERTFRRARSLLGDRMRVDAYIYTTSNVSPINQLRLYLKRWLT